MHQAKPFTAGGQTSTATTRRGALFALAAALSFAVAGACVKAAAEQASNEQIVFVRSLVALLLLGPWLLHRGASPRTQRFGGHLLRAAFGTAAMYCFFHALGRLTLGEAIVLNYCTPLYIPLIAWLWLGERPPWILLPAVTLGLGGICLIAQPGFLGFGDKPLQADLGDYLIGAAAGPLAAMAMVAIRRLSSTEPTSRIVFWFALISTVIAALPLIWRWWQPAEPAHAGLPWAPLIGVGVFATIGQLTMTRAYALAQAARIGAITFAIVAFAAALGWWWWGERLNPLSWTGIALVLICGALASHERRVSQRRPPAGPAPQSEPR